LDEPRGYNNFLQSFKEDLLGGKLGGNRKDFWALMKERKVGLITFQESEVDQIEGIDEKKASEVHPPPHIRTNNSFSRVNLPLFASVNDIWLLYYFSSSKDKMFIKWANPLFMVPTKSSNNSLQLGHAMHRYRGYATSSFSRARIQER
jgi:hypothetical protein